LRLCEKFFFYHREHREGTENTEKYLKYTTDYSPWPLACPELVEGCLLCDLCGKKKLAKKILNTKTSFIFIYNENQTLAYRNGVLPHYFYDSFGLFEAACRK
jgi:hypothetical protein